MELLIFLGVAALIGVLSCVEYYRRTCELDSSCETPVRFLFELVFLALSCCALYWDLGHETQFPIRYRLWFTSTGIVIGLIAGLISLYRISHGSETVARTSIPDQKKGLKWKV